MRPPRAPPPTFLPSAAPRSRERTWAGHPKPSGRSGLTASLPCRPVVLAAPLPSASRKDGGGRHAPSSLRVRAHPEGRLVSFRCPGRSVPAGLPIQAPARSPANRPPAPSIVVAEGGSGRQAGARGALLRPCRLVLARPSGWGSSRPRPLRVGTTVGLGGGVELIRAVSLRPPSRHRLRERFVPHPAQPLPRLVQRCGGRDASLRFRAHRRRWESERGARRGGGGRRPGP